MHEGHLKTLRNFKGFANDEEAANIKAVVERHEDDSKELLEVISEN